MRLSTILLVYAAILFAGFLAGRRKAASIKDPDGSVADMHSLPAYHGYSVMLWGAIPALIAIVGYLVFAEFLINLQVVASLPEALRTLPEAQLNLVLNDVRNLAAGPEYVMGTAPDEAIAAASDRLLDLRQLGSIFLGVAVIVLSVTGCGFAWYRIDAARRARNHVESVVVVCLFLAAAIAVLTTLGIVLSVLFEATRFFAKVPISDFLFGLKWSPQMAIREDQVGSSGAFGAVPLFAGTLLISGLAMIVAVPIGCLVCIAMAEYTSHRGAAPV